MRDKCMLHDLRESGTDRQGRCVCVARDNPTLTYAFDLPIGRHDSRGLSTKGCPVVQAFKGIGIL